MSGIGNRDADAWGVALPKAGIPCPNEKPSAGFHRIDGVSDQVVQDLPYIPLVTNDCPRAAVAHLYINIFAFDSFP